MKLKIIKTPNDILTKISVPVKKITPVLKQLVVDMFETMEANAGIGLAAPQVGQNIRVIVFKFIDSKFKAVLNPVIINQTGSVCANEACLSVPNITVSVCRSEQVTLLGLTIDGTPFELKIKGLLARVIQHEVDHLNGKCIVE